MTLYEVLLFFHILAAIAWIGGGIAINVIGSRIVRSDPSSVAAITRQIEWMGKAFFAPASWVVLILGLSMVAVSEAWTIGQLWIVLALVGIGITAITGAAFFGPEARRISRTIDEGGSDYPGVQRRFRRILVLARLDLVLLLLIVADMVFKPGL
jgi:uncharacterized membrane protein